MDRAELIATLVVDKYSGFREGDQALLETASEARLEEFRAAASKSKAEADEKSRLETEVKNLGARVKVNEERLKAAEQNPSEDEWISKAPESLKRVLEDHKALVDEKKADLISSLKVLNAHTEDELKAKSVEELEILAKYANVKLPDYSGRGLPSQRNAAQNIREDFTPPDPYADAIKALQAAGK